VIPEGAVSPHHVQFHVQLVGAALVALDPGLIVAAGPGLWTGLAGTLATGDGAASGLGAEAADAGALAAVSP
jgi:hypothetical protein